MKIDRASSLFWLSFGTAAAFFSKKLGLGTLTHLGPGFLPFWSGVILGGFSLALCLRAGGPNQGKRVDEVWAGVNWSKPLLVILVLLFYIATVEHLGYTLATTILLLTLFRAVEPVSWGLSLTLSLFTSFASLILFDLWLQVQLPHWFIENFLYKFKLVLWAW